MARRSTCLCLSLCLALAAASAASPAPSFRFHCDATESANAIYHLACLAGQIPCTKTVFERFWHGTLHWTSADQRALDAWITGLVKVERAASPPQAAPYIGNYPSFFPDVDARFQVIRAALESRSLPEFQRYTAHWLSLDEAARLQDAVAYFGRRLRPWWRTVGSHAVKARVRQVEQKLRSNIIVGLADEVSVFVEAESPTRELYLHLVPDPEPRSDDASGTLISNHCFVEVTDAATSDGLASVSLHELTHYLYETPQTHRHLELMQQFVRADVRDASAFYALMNEALAGAVQGVLRERSRESHEAKAADDEYRHPFIPRLARSTVPLLKEAFATRSSLYHDFVQAYVREAIRELGNDVTNPKFFLTAAAVLPTDKAGNAREVFLEAFQTVDVITSDQWRLFSDLNLVFLLTYDELGAFATSFPDLAAYANRRGFAYMGSRDGQARVCFLAGLDAGAIVDVVRAFAKLQSVSSSGLLISID